MVTSSLQNTSFSTASCLQTERARSVVPFGVEDASPEEVPDPSDGEGVLVLLDPQLNADQVIVVSDLALLAGRREIERASAVRPPRRGLTHVLDGLTWREGRGIRELSTRVDVLSAHSFS